MSVGNKLTLFTCVLAHVLAASAFAGEKSLAQYTLHFLQQDSGLPGGAAEAIAQTPDGYLWFGTEEGLARFDGVRFTVFDKANTPALHENRIAAFAWSRDKTLWIATRDGGLVNYRNGSLERATTASGLHNISIASLYADQNDALWIGTADRGLARLGRDHLEFWGPAQGLPAHSVYAITADSLGRIWLATESGAFFYSNGRFVPVELPFTGANREIRSMYAGPKGTIWLGGERGDLFFWDGKAAVRIPGMPNDVITAAMEDHTGTLWLGTGNSGLYRFHNGRFSSLGKEDGLRGCIFSILEDADGGIWAAGHSIAYLSAGPVTTIGKNEGLASDLALGVYGDSQGNLWVGTDQGLTRWHNGLHDWLSPKLLPDSMVFSLTEDHAGDLWAGTRRGLVRIHGRKIQTYGLKDGLPAEAVFSVFADRDGRLWAGSHGGLSWFDGTRFHTYTAQDGVPGSLVTAIYQDVKGVLWIGTDGAGLFRRTGRGFQPVPGTESLGANAILSITGDPDGTMWFATSGAGLLCYRKEHFAAFSYRQGIPLDLVGTVVDGQDGHLWLTSNKGIYRVAKQELLEVMEGRSSSVHPRHFDTADGMRSHECNGGFQPAGWRTPDGNLWFPTMKGVAVIDPVAANVLRRPRAPIVERVLAGTQKVPFWKSADVAPNKRNLTFEFTYPEFTDPDAIQFRYLLDGFDHDWVDAGHRRAAFYTNLPPGTYHLRVLACRDSVCGNETTTAALNLTPSLWERLSFRLAVGLVLTAIAFALYKLRIRQLKKREEKLLEVVEEKTQELRESRDQLEIRVQERTEDLRRLNLALSTEIEIRRDAESKAEAASRAKTEFLTNMSHELRTPINGIMGMADLTMMTELDGEQTEYIGIIRHSADALLGIVTDILDFTQLDQAQVTLADKPFYLDEQIQRACQAPRRLAAEKSLRFILDVDERIPQMLVGDSTSLRKILGHLLDNAVKFTKAGSVELRMELDRVADGVATICFSVRDTGVGVPTDKQAAIFEAFSQADTSSTRRYGGTGLGLTISNHLVRLMTGRLWMRSTPGQGSIFSFVIPFPIQSAISPAAGKDRDLPSPSAL